MLNDGGDAVLILQLLIAHGCWRVCQNPLLQVGEKKRDLKSGFLTSDLAVALLHCTLVASAKTRGGWGRATGMMGFRSPQGWRKQSCF